jgi:flagellar biosynthesis/type III secretory pathway chaperone
MYEIVQAHVVMELLNHEKNVIIEHQIDEIENAQNYVEELTQITDVEIEHLMKKKNVTYEEVTENKEVLVH